MAKRPPDAKTHALKQHGCLNPCAEAVRDELFLSNAFFDPRDLVQVKYEMLRRVREDGVPVSRAAASFGVSRPTWYQAQRAYEAGGLPALLPHRPGPRRPHKLSDEVVEALRVAMSCQYRSKTPQKCRSKSPHSGLAPASPLEGWLGRSNTRRLRGRRAAKGERKGGQDRGAIHDSSAQRAGGVDHRDRQARRTGPQDGAQVSEARSGARDVRTTGPSPTGDRSVSGVSSRAPGAVSEAQRDAVASRDPRAGLPRGPYGGDGLCGRGAPA